MPRMKPAHAASLIAAFAWAAVLASPPKGRGAGPGSAPEVAAVNPCGVQRGLPSEVVVSGSRLAGRPRLVAPFPFRAEALEPSRSGPGNWAFRITVEADAAVGAYPVRVRTDDGLSEPFLFVVGQVPQLAEREDNSAFEAAQPLPATPVVVEGQVPGNDVDYFRFAGRKGQVIVLDAQCARIGSGIDPVIRLTTASASRRFVASADDTPGLLTDARLIAELPEDADYVVELSDTRYQGASRPSYRLTVGAVPIADEVYPLGGRRGETIGLELRGGTLAPGGRKIAAAELAPMGGTPWCIPGLGAAGPVASDRRLDLESFRPLVAGDLPEVREPADGDAPPIRAAAPVVLNGRIDPAGDEDRFAIAATPGQALHVAVEASQLGSALDGVLQVLRPDGGSIASADDTAVKVPGQPVGKDEFAVPDPTLDFNVPPGVSEVLLSIRDLNDRGGVGFPYRIVVTPLLPTFEVQATEPTAGIPSGGTAALPVSIARRGYQGPITVTVVDPPAGLTVRPGTIPAGQTSGACTVSAAAGAEIKPVVLRLVGRGQGPEGSIEVPAARVVVFSRLGILPTCAVVQRGLPAASVLPSPVVLDTPSAPVEIVQGQGVSIPVRAIRGKGVDAALAIGSLPLPPGLSIPAARLPEKADAATVLVNAGIDAAPGPVTIVLEAKGKLPPGEESIAAPAVALNVVRPAEVLVQAPAVDLKAGGQAEVRGEVRRRGTFREPVVVRLTGLPGGLKAEPSAPITVAPEGREFRFKIIAAANATPGPAAIQVAPAYQVNKKDYPAPTLPVTVKVTPAR
ncbi:hypothetical protein OJF2_61450 [Aquisphaera giovannonii]|uniref:Peptidase C-terminal archaeal/bacterial domain-containing protein n=1 Tax=Aquisphaera giovannonii TaxID=406548 RepID=A0A5B9WBC2_9BACT|nr:hypothetical protein [Aquisphaera giovannonii]QEH37554.1 hypothetical protein OJF2_61450 [Aquisphaera giovannonii]